MVLILNQQQCLPKYWTLPMLNNFLRQTLDPQSTEYKFVVDKFLKSWLHLKNQFQLPVPPVSTPGPGPGPLPPPPSLPPVPAPHRMPPRPMLHVPINMTSPSMTAAYPAPMNPGPPFMNNFNNPPGSNQPQPGSHPMLPHSSYPLPPRSNPIVQQNMLPSHTMRPPVPTPPMSMPVPQSPIHPMVPVNQIIGRAHVPVARSRARPAPTPQQIAVGQPGRPMGQTINIPTIIQIERIQNQRWYKQYSAHECEFRQKLGKQTEQWLFHGRFLKYLIHFYSFIFRALGCDERASKNIELECFNRSYAGQHGES